VRHSTDTSDSCDRSSDLNGDQLPDLVSGNKTAGTLSVFLQTCK